MILLLFLLLLMIACLLIWYFLFPVRYVPRAKPSKNLVEPPDLFVYSFVIHIHTQFSFDSLGKPEDLLTALEEQSIDFAIVTDHDNTDIAKFRDKRIIPGKEVKINDEEGKLLGDLLVAGELKVIAHHFREKYRWRLERDEDLIFELIDLRDALLKSKLRLFLYLLTSIFFIPFARKKAVRGIIRLVDTMYYALRYTGEGWKNKIVGGHDHHVIFYFRDVKTKVMIPDYRHSFSLMRNLVLTNQKVSGGAELTRAIKNGFTLISFSEKNSYVWTEGSTLMAVSPTENTYMAVIKDGNIYEEALGSNYSLKSTEKGYYMILGFTYRFRIGRLLFGVRPLFVSDLLEVK